MKPYFSIIVPYHNSFQTIGPLLDSVLQSKSVPPLEVLIVDDGSEERITDKRLKMKDVSSVKVRIVRLQKNKGPAVARNTGAAAAKGKFLVFLDSDIVLFPDALHNLWQIYKEDPDIVAVTGVWVKEQKTGNFFPNFKALRDWSYWINERDKSGYYYLFSTRIASIKRAVFQRLKGFDEKYAGPLVEDIEFTYRIARRYAIIFAPNVRVHHEFEEFWPIAKKYFWRAFYWEKLYERRKKFDPVATTKNEAVTALSGVATAGMFVLYLFIAGMAGLFGFSLVSVNTVAQMVLQGFVVFLVLHIILVRQFMLFVYKERGFIFAVKSFFVGIILYCFISAGALWAKFSFNSFKAKP